MIFQQISSCRNGHCRTRACAEALSFGKQHIAAEGREKHAEVFLGELPLLAPHLPQFPPARCFPCPRVIAPGTGTAALLGGQCPPATTPGHDATGVTPQLLLGHRWHRSAGTALGTGCPCERSWWSLRVVCQLPRLSPSPSDVFSARFLLRPAQVLPRMPGGRTPLLLRVGKPSQKSPPAFCREPAVLKTSCFRRHGASPRWLRASPHSGTQGAGLRAAGKLLGRSRSTAACQAGGKPLRSPVGNNEDKILQTQILSRISDSYSVLTRLPSL